MSIIKHNIFFILLFCGNIAFSQNRIHLERLSVEQGLSQLSVLSIYQDNEGFMWFGTRNGLNKYNGYHFQVFRESGKDTTHISHNHITCIAGDKEGRVWAATNHGLNRYDATMGNFTRYYSGKDTTTISDNTVVYLLSDSDGDFWVGTANGLNRYNFENDCFERYYLDSLLYYNRIYALAESNNGELWLGTSNGVIVYNKHTNTKRIYQYDPDNEHSISQNRIAALFRDRQGNMWVGTHQQGVCLYDSINNRFTRFNKRHGLNDNSIRCFAENEQGDLLVGTFDGLSQYNPHANTFHSAYNNDVLASGHFSIYSVLCDRSGTIWIGTYSGGVSYYSPYNQRFHFYDPGMHGQTIFGIIGPMVEHSGGLWIGTEGGGLLYFNRNNGSFTYYNLPEATYRSYGKNIVKSLLLEGDKLWIGTTRQSVICFDINRKQFEKTITPPWSNLYYALYRDRKQRMWIGATGGQALGYLTAEGQFVNPIPLTQGTLFNPPNVRCFAESNEGSYFVGSWNQGLFCYDEDQKSVHNWMYTPNDTSGLPHNAVSTICKTRDGRIWVGTFGGGFCLFHPQDMNFTVYDEQDGLANNTVCTIVEDRNGKLWVSTLSGISGFDPETGQFTNYGRENGVEIPEFTPGSGMVTADNEVFFGGNNGFVSFRPESMHTNKYIPPVVITDLMVNNVPIRQKHPKGISLEHNQSNLTIGFSALNYIYPHQNQYAYILEGFDKTWNYVGERRMAYYTNIPPGNYTFRVKGSNNDGIWNEDGTRLQISIARPWWNTWWAWTIYISVVASVIILLVRNARIQTQLENSIRIKQMEQENMEELHQTKIKLFTNFSHELRTPLTLILTPLEDMLQQSGLSPALRDTLNLMFKNATRLLYTVNQLMDFRKKESGHLRLKAAQGNLLKFIGEIVITFNELAAKRNISFRLVCNLAGLQLWYDRNLLEKVFFNLLSNAFKNTPDQGEITITLSLKNEKFLKQTYASHVNVVDKSIDEFVLIEVSDTGKGIPDGEQERIFDSFYQVAQNEAVQMFGTGIGLNLSRGVVELHHGAIWADNNADKGAIFRLILPLGHAHLTAAEMLPDYKNSEDISHYLVPDNQPEEPDDLQNGDVKHNSVLIVEDNMDVRHYVKSHLMKYYTILEADNGDNALQLAIDQLPDLIISDIMMPGMDGIRLCNLLKGDLRTGHIPIILLTARVTVLQVQEGFEVGADEYITKPFNAGLLVTRVKNLIASRERLRVLFGQKSGEPGIELPSSQVDNRFMDTIYGFLNENMSDPDLNMDTFCKEIGMSRTNLYRKIKSVTNLSPSELIRNTRLKYAAKYLSETDLSISEIAYKVGFSSPSYFTKTFRAFFGVSPSKMRDGE